MKAWIVYCGYDWVSLMHADTRGKAISLVRKHVDDQNEYIDFSAKRFPKMDDKAFTYKDCKNAGFVYEPEEVADFVYADICFVNDCPCDICKATQ